MRPGVRGGPPTRGFPPGSAQALVALVLGLAAGVVGLQRDDHLLAVVFFAVAALGGVGLARVVRRWTRGGDDDPGQERTATVRPRT